MVGIGFMLYEQPMFSVDVYVVGYVLLLLAAGMTLWSMIMYLRAAWPSMASND
jgi:phosphatidylglycerophosphate synthase